MRIGLARHFPVLEPWPGGWRTAAELQAWRLRYDAAETRPLPVEDETARWARCYASDLTRAQTTARVMYQGEIITHAGLREAEFAPFATGSLRLPVWLWRTLIRLAWMNGHASQRHLRDDFFARVRSIAELIESQQQDLLIVSHAGMMFYLRKELLRRGFRGPAFQMAGHARVYVFERPWSGSQKF